MADMLMAADMEGSDADPKTYKPPVNACGAADPVAVDAADADAADVAAAVQPLPVV